MTIEQQTAKQQMFERLLVRNSPILEEKNDAFRRFTANAAIFATATAVDMAESHVVDAILRKPLQAKIAAQDTAVHALPRTYTQEHNVTVNEILEDPNFQSRLHEERKKAIHAEGIEKAADFIEEWASDTAYVALANAWLRSVTGNPDAIYVSEAADFLSEWTNKVLQIFLGNPLLGQSEPNPDPNGHAKFVPKRTVFGIKLGYEAADLVNAVNVEALLRMMEEVPGIKNGITRLRHGIEHALENPTIQKLHTIADLGVMGYFFGTSAAKEHHHI